MTVGMSVGMYPRVVQGRKKGTPWRPQEWLNSHHRCCSHKACGTDRDYIQGSCFFIPSVTADCTYQQYFIK